MQTIARRIKVQGGKPITVNISLPANVSIIPRKKIRHRLLRKSITLLNSDAISFIIENLWKRKYELLISRSLLKKYISKRKRDYDIAITKIKDSHKGDLTFVYDGDVDFSCLLENPESEEDYYRVMKSTIMSDESKRYSDRKFKYWLLGLVDTTCPSIEISRHDKTKSGIFLNIVTSEEYQQYAKRPFKTSKR
jgi:hypothetical protein